MNEELIKIISGSYIVFCHVFEAIQRGILFFVDRWISAVVFFKVNIIILLLKCSEVKGQNINMQHSPN